MAGNNGSNGAASLTPSGDRKIPGGLTPSSRAGAPRSIVSSQRILKGLRKSESKRLIRIIEEMRADHQFAFVERVTEANLSSSQVTVSAEGGDERLDSLAERLQDLWNNSVRSMCEAFALGRVAYESVWQYDESLNLHYIESLEQLPFSQTEMLLDEAGEFSGIELTGKDSRGNQETITIEAVDSWWLAVDATIIEPHGRSRFLGAPEREFLRRKTLSELHDKLISKFCLRGGVIRGPQQVRDSNGQMVDAAEQFSSQMDILESGGWIYLPDTRDSNGNFEYQIDSPPELEDPAPIDSHWDKSDVRVLRAFGISELSVQQTGEVGSFAMSVMHRLILSSLIQGLLEQFTGSFRRGPVQHCIDVNFGPGAAVDITVTFPDMTAVEDSLMVELAKSLATSPQVSPMALALDVRAIFEAAGIPVTPDFEARIQEAVKAVTAAAAVPQFGSQQVPQGGGLPRPGVTMSNEPAKSSLAGVPSREEIAEAAVGQASSLFGRLYDLAEELRSRSLSGEPGFIGEIDRIRDEMQATINAIRDLLAETGYAARLIGMVSPWLPSLQDAPAGSPRQTAAPVAPVTMANSGVRFPWLQQAVDWLLGREVVAADQFNAMQFDEQQQAFSAPGVTDSRLLDDILLEVADSVQNGETLETFRGRIAGQLSLPQAQVETLYRTNTKRAYVEGQERTLSTPVVQEEFPFVMLSATSDTSVRPEHEAVDGVVVRRGTPEYTVLSRLVRDWNCRCVPIPLTESQAASYKISTLADFPLVTRQKYG